MRFFSPQPAKAYRASPTVEKQSLVEELKRLNWRNCQIIKYQKRLKSSLKDVTIRQKETQSFIEQFQSYVRKQHSGQEKSGVILLKLKAREERQEQECNKLRENCKQAKKKQKIALGEHEAMLKQIQQLSAFKIKRRGTERRPLLLAELFQLDQTLDQLRAQRDYLRNQIELRECRFGPVRLNQVNWASKQQARLHQTVLDLEATEYEPSVEDRLQESENICIKLREKNAKLRKLMEEEERVQQQGIKRLESVFYQLDRRKSYLCELAEEDKPKLQSEAMALLGRNLLQVQRKQTQIQCAVLFKDVQEIGKNLNLVCCYLGLSSSQFISHLFQSGTRSYSVRDLAQRLGETPFKLVQKQARLLARYLVEQSKIGKVSIDQRLTATQPVVKSIFQKVLGKVDQFDKAQVKAIWEELRTVAQQPVNREIPLHPCASLVSQKQNYSHSVGGGSAVLLHNSRPASVAHQGAACAFIRNQQAPIRFLVKERSPSLVLKLLGPPLILIILIDLAHSQMKKMTTAVVVLMGMAPYANSQLQRLQNCWMSRLSGSTPIADISLPGTHDSAAFVSGRTKLWKRLISWHWRTQDWSIMEQLEKGVRLFDLRVNNAQNPNLYHGPIALQLGLAEVLCQIKQFLQANPSQFVIAFVKHQAQELVPSSQKSQVVIQDCIRRNVGERALSLGRLRHVPRVGEVRGKLLIVLRQFQQTTAYPRVNFKRNTIFRLQVGKMGLLVQDVFNATTEQKIAAIEAVLKNVDRQCLLSFGSGYGGLIPLPRDFSSSINQHLVTRGPLRGWWFLDFPTEPLVSKIISANFDK